MLPCVLHNKSDEDDAQTDWEFGTGFPALNIGAGLRLRRHRDLLRSLVFASAVLRLP